MSGIDRAFKSFNSMFQKIGDRLNPLGKSVDVDILFLGPPSGIYSSHASMMILKFWSHENETGSLFALKISQFLVTDDVEITCHYMAS